MASPSEFLLSMGRSVLTPYSRLPGVACTAITGSSAEGHSDTHSDLDTTIYYDEMPPEADIRAIREQVGGGPLLWSLGSYAEGEFIESYRLKGVEVQIGHTTVARWEADIAKTLAGEEPGSPLHKAMSGTLVSIAVNGDERLEAWKRTLRVYPDVLRVAMVKHFLKFFAMWGVIDRLYIRDSNLWMRQALVESSFNLLGVAAGLEPAVLHDVSVQAGGALHRGSFDSSRRSWGEAGGVVGGADSGGGAGLARAGGGDGDAGGAGVAGGGYGRGAEGAGAG